MSMLEWRCIQRGAMKIIRKDGDLIIRDRPAVFWLFYSLFIIGGVVALAVLPEAEGWQARTLIAAVGAANIIGGAAMMLRDPATVMRISCATKEIAIRRWNPLYASERSLRQERVVRAEVMVGEHTEGGSIFRPGLALDDGSVLPVSCFWYQTRERSQDVVRAINEALAVSRTGALDSLRDA